MSNQIETKLEDLRQADEYPANYFDFIYARLVLHYLSSPDLDRVLANFHKMLNDNGRLFVVVRSEKNIPNRSDVTFDKQTQMTSISHYDSEGKATYMESRYFHSAESIQKHLKAAGFLVREISEYQEQLYKDFMRKEIEPKADHVIEVLTEKDIGWVQPH